jgi:hypothetical protein
MGMSLLTVHTRLMYSDQVNRQIGSWIPIIALETTLLSAGTTLKHCCYNAFYTVSHSRNLQIEFVHLQFVFVSPGLSPLVVNSNKKWLNTVT